MINSFLFYVYVQWNSIQIAPPKTYSSYLSKAEL